jgi:CheY-like chemotaxis protein
MNHTILMVENDSDNRLLTEEMFRAEGLTAEIDFIYSTALKGYIPRLQPGR